MNKQWMWKMAAGTLVFGGCGDNKSDDADDAKVEVTDDDEKRAGDDTSGNDTSGDDKGDDTDDDDSSDDDRDNGDPAKRGKYVVSTTVYGPDTETPIIHVVDSLTEVGQVSDTDALETTQTGVVRVPGQRAFIGIGFNDPSVTRFELNDEGVPVETARISAANHGVEYLYKPTVVGENEVWFLSTGDGFKVFRTNIDTMEFTDVLDFEELYDEAFPGASLTSALLRDDTLFFTARYRDWEAGVLKPGVTVLALNLETLAYEIFRDDRCSDGQLSTVGDDVIVAASHPIATGDFLLGAEGIGEPCVLRIRKGETRIDADWIRYYADWTDGRRGGGMFPVKPEVAYIRVLDESLGPKEPEQATDWAYADAWSWARVNPLGDEPAVLVDGPPSHGPVDAHQVGDEVWSFDHDTDAQLTTLRRLDEDGFTTGASFNGYVFGIMKLDE
jgi:hypothetical protein